MTGFGKMLIIVGLLIAGAGLFITLAGKFPWFGRLPGDIYIKKENVSFYFPLATSILVSVVISLLLWLFRK